MGLVAISDVGVGETVHHFHALAHGTALEEADVCDPCGAFVEFHDDVGEATLGVGPVGAVGVVGDLLEDGNEEFGAGGLVEVREILQGRTLVSVAPVPGYFREHRDLSFLGERALGNRRVQIVGRRLGG